jgi:hypothetical protein
VLEKTVLIWLKSDLHNGRPGASIAEAEGCVARAWMFRGAERGIGNPFGGSGIR